MQATTLRTGRHRRRVHPGFLGLLNRYASRAALSSTKPVPDKPVDDTNLFKWGNKNAVDSLRSGLNLRRNELFIYSLLLMYLPEFYSSAKQNYLIANNFGTQMI